MDMGNNYKPSCWECWRWHSENTCAAVELTVINKKCNLCCRMFKKLLTHQVKKKNPVTKAGNLSAKLLVLGLENLMMVKNGCQTDRQEKKKIIGT